MLCKRRTSDLGLLPILILFLGAEYIILGLGDPVSQRYPAMQQKDNSSLDSTISSSETGKLKTQSKSTPPSEEKKWMSVPVDKQAVLSCPSVALKTLITATWIITFGDNTSCTRAYRSDTNATVENNCTDKRITWDSGPEQNFALQIAPVAITHDGSYTCDMATSEGNFLYEYHLQVSVPPHMTVFLTANRTVVCQAVAGKPAAQITWTPESSCVTEQESHSNGTVSVQSMCHWEEGNESTVTCFISHLTGNRSLSLDLHPNERRSTYSILYSTISVLIIVIIILTTYFFVKTNGCRKCTSTKKKTTRDFEQDEMEPYASYTEKSNPVYDSINKEMFQMLQNEAAAMDVHTVSNHSRAGD